MTITDAAADEKVTTIFCAPVARDPRCADCGREGRYRDTVTRALTDLPVAGCPLALQIAVPRYRAELPGAGRHANDGKPRSRLAHPPRTCRLFGVVHYSFLLGGPDVPF